MNILINCSNLSGGGGAQVADSLCCSLNTYTQHKFTVVLSHRLRSTAERIKDYTNIYLYEYSFPSGDWKSFIYSRNETLDNLVYKNNIDCVLTVFGPMKWRPRCPHLSGFALSQLLLPESPYFKRMSVLDRVKMEIRVRTWAYIFHKSADFFYTENSLITERLQSKFKDKKIFTVTNYYNQVFDEPQRQVFHQLPDFNGWQLLNVGSSNPHKNLNISIEIARILKNKYWDVIQRTSKPNFRFLFTTKESELASIPEDLREHFYFIDKVDISEVPSLYKQCDVVFQPTLLECFTAVYPEAMRMKKPIITTNLEFARGLCGNAAVYYSATNAGSAAEELIKVLTDSSKRERLVKNGLNELLKFDNYNSRLEKLINLCLLISNSKT